MGLVAKQNSDFWVFWDTLVDLHIVELAGLLDIVLVLFWMSDSLGAPSTKEMEERLGLGPPVLLRLLHYVTLVQHKLATLIA